MTFAGSQDTTGFSVNPNVAILYEIIWREGPISRSDLVQRTGLTKSTVSVNVDDLLARGLVEETGFRPSGLEGGRRAKLLRVNAHSHVVAGIHLGVRQTRVVIADALGEELEVRTGPTLRRNPVTTLKRTGEMVGELIDSLGIDRALLSAVGVAIPGVVDKDTGVCRVAPNLGWRNVPVSEILGEAVGVPTYVNNTAQAMAVAEANDAASRGETTDLALLYVGTGVGSATVINGRLLRGSNGFSGEIGHVSVGSGIPCPCGNTGCLETLVSGPAIARRALDAGIGKGIRKRSALPAALGRAAADGDAAARELISDVGRELGHAAAWLVQVTDPKTLVIAGGVSALGDLLIDPLRRGLQERVMPDVFDSLHVRRSHLDSQGKLRGAVLVALKQLDDPAERLSNLSVRRPTT